MVKKILITGGLGFIGKNIIKYIINKEKFYHIRVIDNLSNSKISEFKNISNFNIIKNNKNFINNSKGIFFYKGDILNKKILINSFKNIDIVIHLAANTGVEKSISDPTEDLKKNILGTLQILEHVKKFHIKKFIFSSSNAVVGDTTKQINEKTLTRPVNQYGVSKLSAEAYINAYNNLYNINTTILRFGNVYGSGSKKKGNIIPLFIKRALNDKICYINGNGTQTRDFIFIDDLCDAIFKCIKNNNIAGETFQIASGKQTSINTISNIISKEIKNLVKKEVTIKYRKSRKGDVEKNYSNINKAKKLLKWQPQTNLKLGITKTINFFLNEKNN